MASEATSRARIVRPIWEHVFVTHPAYIREKAREMRREKRRPDYELRARENSLRYKRMRDEAYEEGWSEYDRLILEPTFRDFVCMYIGEGFKRCRNRVALCNSDANVVALATF